MSVESKTRLTIVNALTDLLQEAQDRAIRESQKLGVLAMTMTPSSAKLKAQEKIAKLVRFHHKEFQELVFKMVSMLAKDKVDVQQFEERLAHDTAPSSPQDNEEQPTYNEFPERVPLNWD